MEKEEWKKIDGLEGQYMVSSYGRIWSVRYNREVRSYNNQKNDMGYLRIKLKGQGYFIHRLVASAFLTNNKKLPCVNHKDTIKINNNVSNLEWVTSSENAIHAYLHGLMPDNSGENNGRAILCEEEVLTIRGLENIYLRKELSEMFGVSISTVYKIQQHKRWKCI